MRPTMTKPKIEVFSPAGVCGCSFSAWIGNVWDILMKYKDQLEIESLTSDSSRAHELGVGGRTVVINGEITPIFLLDQKIQELLRKEY
ncbi:hypothetical protein CEE45_08085 [Candidatus Heimdallarchaeota archaeon B3_Heim]|nr:MAG: hypothetical protein CEE45_08085 [Candidatus Heimdallarchaeota archaeon B3_Heim]